MQNEGFSLRIKKSSLGTIFLIILMIPFIQSRTYTEMPAIIGNFYNVGALVSATIFFIRAILFNRKGLQMKNIWLFLAFWVCYIFITMAFLYSSTSTVLHQAYIYLGLIVGVNHEIRKNPTRLLFSLTFIYTVLTLANLILMFLFPKGLYAVSTYHSALLLGDDNAIAFVVLPGVAISLIYSFYKYGKLKLFALIELVAAGISFIVASAISAIVSYIVFVVFFILVFRGIKLSPYFFIIAFFAAVFFIFTGSTNSLISDIIVNVFHKTVTYSGRVTLWTQALQMISKSPIFGYGGFFKVGSFVSENGLWRYPCHTPYLQILLDGGIVLFGIFVSIIVKAFASLSKIKNNVCAQILIIGMFSIMLNYIFEQSTLLHLFIMCTIAMNSDVFSNAADRIVKVKRKKGKAEPQSAANEAAAS